MKKLTLLFAFMACFFATSCDQGFDEVNTNKVDPTSLAPSLVLNKAIISTTYLDGFGTLGMLTYNFGIVQQIITPYGSSLSGGSFVSHKRRYYCQS